MKFSENLKRIREEKKLTQEQFSKLCGVSPRMIQRYESGTSLPRFGAVEKLALALGIPFSELICENELLVTQAAPKYGSRGAKQAEELISEVTGLFAGGEMADEDMDVMMKAIQDAYWLAKEKNRKYARKNNPV